MQEPADGLESGRNDANEACEERKSTDETPSGSGGEGEDHAEEAKKDGDDRKHKAPQSARGEAQDSRDNCND